MIFPVPSLVAVIRSNKSIGQVCKVCNWRDASSLAAILCLEHASSVNVPSCEPCLQELLKQAENVAHYDIALRVKRKDSVMN